MGTLCSFSSSKFGTLFKYRESVIKEVAKVNMVKHILLLPPQDEVESWNLSLLREMINSLKFLY